MKKIIAVGLTLCLMLALFSGCGTAEKPAGNGGNTPALSGQKDNTAPSAGGAKGAEPEESEDPNAALNDIISKSGTKILGGWDQEAFGIVPEPKDFEYSMMSMNANERSEMIGYAATEEAYRAYLTQLDDDGWVCKDGIVDRYSDGSLEFKALKAGNELRVTFKSTSSGSGGQIELWPAKTEDAGEWPADIMGELPRPNAVISDIYSDGAQVQFEYISKENFLAYVEECLAAGLNKGGGSEDNYQISAYGGFDNGDNVEMYWYVEDGRLEINMYQAQ